MRFKTTTCAVFLLLAGLRPAIGSDLKPVTSVEGITEYKLANGLKVLLDPDQTKPTVTVNITYFVGSRHEGYGEAGMAHLLEHMMFKGTPHRKNIWGLLEDHGARFNGTTWTDRTNYFETLPANRRNLEFALAMEADRMVNSSIDEKQLAKEFSVVRNEFELGENRPLEILEERIYSTAYLWHNYGRSTIGSKSDIERVPAKRLRVFYKRYYQPDNAMLVVAGKFQPKEALDLVLKHFGAIPRPQRVLPKTYTVEPVQDGERLVVLRRTGDVGAVGVAYHGLAGSAKDFVAEQALVNILTTKPSGRLYQGLVESGLASDVFGDAYSWAEPGMMHCIARVPQEKPLEPVRDKMIEVVEGLVQGGITKEEVARAKARAFKEIELAMTDTGRVGVWLSEWAAIGDWRMLFVTRDRIEALTKDDVERVAREFLVQSNRTVGMFVPTKEPVRSILPQPVDVAAAVKNYQGRKTKRVGTEFVATIPAVEKAVVRGRLANGLKYALLSKPTTGGAVTGSMSLHVGTEATLKGRTTAGELLPSLLERGTKEHDFQALQDAKDRLKANIGLFGNDLGGATISLKTVRSSLTEVLDLLAEMLREPSFPKDQFDLLKRERLARLESERQDPNSRGFSAIFRNMTPYPKDDIRYQPTIDEKIERIKALDLADLKSFYGDFYGVENAELTLVGDFDTAAVKAQLESLFRDFRSKLPYERIKSPYRDAPPKTVEVNTPDKESAMIAVGHALDIQDTSPDYPALKMLNYIFGASAKSRLLSRLRQKEGYSYGTFSSVYADWLEPRGYVFAAAFCAPQNAKKALAAMLEELSTLIDTPVTKEDLEAAKASYAKKFSNRLSSDRYLARAITGGLEQGRTLDFEAKVNAAIDRLTSDQLSDAARRYFKMKKLVKVTSGDLAKVERKNVEKKEEVPAVEP